MKILGGPRCRSIVWAVIVVRPFFAFGHLAGDLAADRGDLALQVAHAGLPGVVRDDRLERPVGEVDELGRQAVLLDLLGDEVAAGDLELLLLGVAAAAR